MDISKYTKLIFSGGSTRGLAYIGIIKYLKSPKQFEYICGSSIGALFGFLFSLDYKYDDYMKYIYPLSYENSNSIDIDFNNFGFDNFSKIKETIILMLTQKNINENITFIEHFKLTNINLSINATCLNNNSGVYFNYINNPDMPILIAIQASMAIPILFQSVKYNNLTYIDGDICNPLVNLNIFTNSNQSDCDYKSILCINLYQENKTSLLSINSIKDYITCLMNCFFNKITYIENITYINVFENVAEKFNFLDLIITNETKNKLISLGENAL